MAARAARPGATEYQLSAAAPNGNEPLIGAVHLAPAGETDGLQAQHLIDTQPPQRRPNRILADTAYGNRPVRAELAEREVEVPAPVPEGPGVEGRFAKHDFGIDLEHRTVSCPGGNTAQISVPTKGFRQASFSAKVCGACPLKAQCCPGHARRQISSTITTNRGSPPPQPSLTPLPRSSSGATDHGSSRYPDCSPTATALAKAATSAAPKPDASRLGGCPGQPQTRADTAPPSTTHESPHPTTLRRPPPTEPIPTMISRTAITPTTKPTSSGAF